MKKLLLVAFLATSLMSLQSCGGDDNVAPSGGSNNGGGNNGGGNNGGGNNGGGNTTTANLPIFIDIGDEDDVKIEYDSKDRFSKITVEGSTNVVSEFTYNNDVLTELKQTYGSISHPTKIAINRFTYSNNSVNVVSDDPIRFEKTMIFDNQGLLLSTYNYRSSSNEKYTEYYTYDNNKNMITFGIDNYYKVDYTYDNSNGIFKNVKMPQWAMYYSLYNSIHTGFCLSIYSNIEDISGGGKNMNNFQYKYNSDNYPISLESDYLGLWGNITYSK